MRRRVIGMLAASTVIVLLATGCGDDSGGGDDVAAYCEKSAELDAADGLPSDADLDEIKELAPSEISDQVAVLVDAFQDEGEAAFENAGEEFIAASQAVEGFEADNCDSTDSTE